MAKNVLDDFIAFAEKLVDNGIILEVKDVIALFKMLKADQKYQYSPRPYRRRDFTTHGGTQ